MSTGTTDPSAGAETSGTSARREALVVRYGELALKGGNRPKFERDLGRNLRQALEGTAGLRIDRIRGRMLVRADVPVTTLAAAASRVFGIVSLSPAIETPREFEAILAVADEQVATALRTTYAGRSEVPFRVTVKRADKTFPLTSVQLEREIGGTLAERNPALRVDLRGAELNVEVDLRSEGVWVFSERTAGPGGLPVGSLGKVLCLLSGGIDSPVSAWLAMKRGMRVEFVSFYSFPHVGPQTREKLVRQVRQLAKWQQGATLHIVPFAAYQEAIRDLCPPHYRTVLYRRAMQRLASAVARRRKCYALVTGESVGQVASQTLENLTVIEAASTKPVLRPLVTFDKQEAIDLARHIGTFEISNLPAPDCCTVFQPERPVIRGRIDEAQAAEAALDLDRLTADALRGTEKLRFPDTP